MAQKRFLKGFAFSNLAGSRFLLLLKLYTRYGVDSKYRFRAFLNAFLAMFLSLFSLLDRLVWLVTKKKVGYVADPLFIIGHWRSGTTRLHNLLCLDERAGFTTTFQTVFPNNLFGFHKPLLWIMGKLMPAQRPVDNLPLNPHKPQEEEFGLGNVIDTCYYLWWYFPKAWQDILRDYLTLQNLSDADQQQWKRDYLTYIKRALLYQNKHWLISKNPPNTARIKILLEMFPDARFVYIYRNPYEVYVSSQRFFKAILEPLQLQEISDAELNANILSAYKAMLDAYEDQKSLIPNKRLVEIKYEDFIKNQLGYLRYIYNTLEIKLPKVLAHKWEDATKVSHHTANTYAFSAQTIAEVNNALGDRIEKMGYERLS